MTVSVTTETLELEHFSVDALFFIPNEIKYNYWALFSHGYTSHKGSILNWAIRLSESGFPVVIHDQPGHFLGSFHEVKSFEDFSQNAHKIFAKSFELLKQKVGKDPDKLILGGHSLGGLTSTKALELPVFKGIDKLAIGVGFGLNNESKTHLFDTDFYKQTLVIRNQLVSKNIQSDKVFPWIRDQKNQLKMSGHRIHLISGENDLVVGSDGAEILRDLLEGNGNNVTLFKPKNLAHHVPENATPHIMKFLRTELNL